MNKLIFLRFFRIPTPVFCPPTCVFITLIGLKSSKVSKTLFVVSGPVESSVKKKKVLRPGNNGNVNSVTKALVAANFLYDKVALRSVSSRRHLYDNDQRSIVDILENQVSLLRERKYGWYRELPTDIPLPTHVFVDLEELVTDKQLPRIFYKFLFMRYTKVPGLEIPDIVFKLDEFLTLENMALFAALDILEKYNVYTEVSTTVGQALQDISYAIWTPVPYLQNFILASVYERLTANLMAGQGIAVFPIYRLKDHVHKEKIQRRQVKRFYKRVVREIYFKNQNKNDKMDVSVVDSGHGEEDLEVPPNSREDSLCENPEIFDWSHGKVFIAEAKGKTKSSPLNQINKQDSTKPNHRKIKEVKRQPEPLKFSEDDLLFDDESYDGMEVPTALSLVKFCDVPAILGSISRAVTTVERKRNYATIRSTWMADIDSFIAMKKFLIEYYAGVVDLEGGVVGKIEYKMPEGIDFRKDQRLYMDPILIKHFQPRPKGKSKTKFRESLLQYNQGLNFIYDLMKDPVKSRTLAPNRLRSILQQKCTPDAKLDDVLNFFKNKCYIIKSFNNINKSLLSWVHPYVSLEWYYVGFADEDLEEVQNLFRDAVTTFRSKLLNFVAQYYSISRLSRHERKNYFKEKASIFAEQLRTPECQALFASGATKQEICDLVMRDFDDQMVKKVGKGVTMVIAGKNKERVKHVTRSRARDAKYETIFETESLGSLQTLYWFYSWIGWFVLVITPVYAVCEFLFRTDAITVAKNWIVSYYHGVVGRCSAIIGALQIADRIQTSTAVTVSQVSAMVQATNLREPQTQVYLLEFKTVIHIIYALYRGDSVSALEWATNFLVTRGIDVIDLIRDLDIEAFKSATDKPCLYSYKGIKYTIKREHFQKILDAYGTDTFEATLSLYGEPVTVDVESFDVVGDFVVKILSRLKLIDMDDSEVRAANNQFTYVNHWKKDVSESVRAMMTVISVVSRHVFNYDPFDNGYNDFLKELTILMEKIHVAYQEGEHMARSRERMTEIDVLYERATEMMLDPMLETVNPQVKRLFSAKHAEITKLSAWATKLRRGAVSREEPVFVLFTGRPSTGKTACTNFLRAAICYLLGMTYSPEMTFEYNGQEYWEGYVQQMFVFMDDAFRSKDVKKREVETDATISMVNTSVYNLNRAFGEKGASFFNSDFIFATTNTANDGIEHAQWNTGLVCDEALIRRFTLVLHKEKVINSRTNLMEELFRIDKCDIFPTRVKTWIKVKELPQFILDIKTVLRENAARIRYDNEFFSTLYPRVDIHPDSVPLVIDDNQIFSPPEVEVQSGDLYAFLNNLAYGPSERIANPGEPDVRYESRNVTQQSVEAEENKLTYVKRLDKMLRAFRNSARPLSFNIMDYAAPVLAAITLTFAAYSVYTYTQNFSTLESKEDKIRTGRRTGQKSQIKDLRARKFSTFKDESGHLDNYHECLLTTMCRGTFVIKAVCDNPRVSQVAKGIHIKDGYAVIPAHFYYPLVEGTNHICTITVAGSSEVQIPWIQPTQVLRVTDEDMIFFRLPTNIDKPKSMYTYIYQDSDIVLTDFGLPITLVSTEHDATPCIKFATRGYSEDKVPYEAVGQCFVINQPITYEGKTQKGDSGSMVTVQGKQGRPIVLGMHVGKTISAKDVTGLAIPFSRTIFDNLIKCYEKEILNPDFIDESQDFPLVVHHNVPITEANYPPTRSKLTRTCLFGIFGEALKAPAHLRAKDGEDNLMYKAVFKLHQEQTPAKPMNQDNVHDFLELQYPRPLKSSRFSTQILTWEQALRGDPVRSILPICYGTSPGYGYNRNGRGKTSYLVLRDDLSYDYTPELLESLQQYEVELLAGRQIEVIWGDVLKDELKILEKVHKPRLFTSCQLHYLLLVRRFFGPFVAYAQSMCVEKPMAPGLNVHSLQHTALYTRLAQTAGSVIAGDFSNYDGRLPKYVGEVAIRYINWWFNDEYTEVRNLLAQHIFNARHIVYDMVYDVVDGNPSGNPITTLYNSMCNVIMCFVILTEDMHFRTDQFQLTVYGDDNVITVQQPGLRVADFSPFFKERFGLEYTHYSKQENHDYDTLFTISYLGRKFVRQDSVMKAPLDINIILQMMYYYTRGTNEEEVLIDTARSFYSELAHHPRSVFQKYTSEFFAHVEERCPGILAAVRHECKTYYDYQHQMYYSGSAYIPVVIESAQLQSKDSKFFESYFPETDKVKTSDGPDTSRSINIPTDTQQVQLGSYQDVDQIVANQFGPRLREPQHSNMNLEEFKLDNVLLREYQVANITWSGASATGTTLLTLKFPQVLFDIPFIQAKINNFYFFAGAIRLNIRIACSKFGYGKIAAFYKPWPSQDPYLASIRTNIYRDSGNPHWLISAAASESTVITIPFIHPERALCIPVHDDDEMGELTIRVLNPLISCTPEILTAQIFVTAQFQDASLYLPNDFDYAAALTAGVAESKTEFVPESEAELKSSQGVISSALARTDTVLSVIERLPIAGGHASMIRTFTRPAAKLTAAAGLDKPTTLNVLQVVKNDPAFDLANGRGGDTNAKLCMDPQNGVSATPRVGGSYEDDMNIATLAGIPRLWNIINLTPTSDSTLSPYELDNTAGRMGYMDFIALNFEWWTGSVKLKIYFTASLMQTARVVFYLTNAGAVKDWTQCVHEVVSITGDTEFEMTLPYVQQRFVWTKQTASNYYLGYKILAWSQNDSSISNPIAMNIYRAAGEDFQVYGQMERMFVAESDVRADFRKTFKPLKEDMGFYDQRNLVVGEKHEHLSDILHKYYPYSSVSSGTSVAGFSSAFANTFMGTEMWSLPYAYWSGATRIKLWVPHKAGTVLNLQNGADNLIGTTMSTTTNPFVACEIPYYTDLAYRSTRPTTSYDPMAKFSSATSTAFVFRSTGDDFRLFWPCSWPPGTFSNPSVDKGYSALRAYNPV